MSSLFPSFLLPSSLPISSQTSYHSSNRCSKFTKSFKTFPLPCKSPSTSPKFLCSTAPSKPLTRSTLESLQNGSDIRGVAISTPLSPVTLSPSTVRLISAAFARHVAQRLNIPITSLHIAIGRDSRISGPSLTTATASGLNDVGVTVADAALCTTPAMFMSTVLPNFQYHAAIMLTASHLPPDRNGLKFFTKQGGASKKDISDIISKAADILENKNPVKQIPLSSPPISIPLLNAYSKHLISLIQKGCSHPTNPNTPLKGFRIVVDAGNGAAGFFATNVLTPLGADVIGQFLEPDGSFPNHVPNPEDKKAMQMTIDTVLDSKADLGIIFDTDVDRSGVVDSNGLDFNRNRLIALMTRIVLQDHPGTTIVTDSVTSNGLAQFIEQYGGKHFRFKKGYKNVIDKAIQLSSQGISTELAIETSGHGAMKENYMLDDGAYLAVKILIEMVRLRLANDSSGIGTLVESLQAPKEEKEFRLKFIEREGFKEYGANVVQAFADFSNSVDGWKVEDENYEGFRVNVDEGDGKRGWLLLRPSLHDPLLALNIESETDGGIAKIGSVLIEKFFPQHSNVDISSLQSHCE